MARAACPMALGDASASDERGYGRRRWRLQGATTLHEQYLHCRCTPSVARRSPAVLCTDLYLARAAAVSASAATAGSSSFTRMSTRHR